MSVKARAAKSFKKQARKLIKKYPSLNNELKELENELLNNPRKGDPIGKKCYKIRLRIASKGKGKSGGARVITYLETEIIGILNEKEKTVNLISIYDKSEVETISDKEVEYLLENLEFD